MDRPKNFPFATAMLWLSTEFISLETEPRAWGRRMIKNGARIYTWKLNKIR